MKHHKGTRVTALAAVLLIQATPLLAQDARTMGLGGSSISASTGVQAAIENPSLLASQKRAGDKTHFLFGASVILRDNNDLISTLEDNENLIDDFETEIDRLAAQPLVCSPIDDPQTTCLTGTQPLANLAGDILDLFEVADREKLEGRATSMLGFSVPFLKIPVAFFLQASATATGFSDISDDDKTYVSDITAVLTDDNLSLDEIQNSTPLTYNAVSNTVDIALPDDVLTSQAQVGVIARVQLGAAFAFPVNLGGFAFDLGVTPKFSTLTASGLDTTIRSIEDGDDLSNKFENNEVSESSFSVDLGMSAALPYLNALRAGVVIRNLIPESVSVDGVDFETTPQMIVGGSFDAGLFTLTSDLALNAAKLDNFETQLFNAGAEIGFSWLAFRAGIQHDLSVDNKATSLSLGAGLGVFDIAAQFNGSSSMQASASVSFGF